MEESILKVHNLRTDFVTKKGVVSAINGVDFEVKSGEILGIVGESGCGKSVTSLSILGLLAENAKIDSNSEILFQNKNLVALKEKEMCDIRGKEIAMIFQDPMTSLNPVKTIEKQLMEVILIHKKVSKKEAREQSLAMLKKVGIPSPERRMKEYPHQLSGGMKQRVGIAMALMCQPKLLIADEPTTALDVTIQAQILQLMKQLQADTKASIMLITHDMGVVASMTDSVLVMYAGEVVEYGKTEEVFTSPKHPYTMGLLKSIPRLNQENNVLYTIKGTVPNQYDMPKGCRFYPRCDHAMKKCKECSPDLIDNGNGKVKCFLYEGGMAHE